jgi:hypothetical protein
MEPLASDVREMVTSSIMDDYSPWSPDVMNPYLSTPQDLTMDTPSFQYLDESQMITGPDCGPLFPMFPEWEDAQEPDEEDQLDEEDQPDYSPWSPDVMNPNISTPQDSTMDTPLFQYLDESQMITGPDCGHLFPKFPEWEDVQEPVAESKAVLDPSSLIVMTPTSPHLDSFDPSQLSAPQPTIISSAVAKAPASRRKVTATDIRKGITPETLLDESAPTQSRKYATPSATSRKEVPAVFARKRARSTAFGDEEDQLDDYVLPPNPTEMDLIEQKRRQNTVAARRSPKRKLEHPQLLESSLEKVRQEKERWRERAYMLSRMLVGHSLPVPDFIDDES